MNYEREKTKQNKEKLKKITENFLLSNIESDDDVLKFLFEANKRLEKVRKNFPNAIKLDCCSIHNKLRKNGYTSTLKTSEELKKYKNDYEIMACLCKNKELVANTLISDTMKSLCSFGLLDPKIGKGITEYYYKYIKTEEVEKNKVKTRK